MEICVASDLSPSSERAFELACGWAKRQSASLLLLHVVHDPELAPALGNNVPGDVAAAQAALSALAASAEVTCRVDVRTAEDVVDEILAAAKGCRYLFLGSQGKSTFERLRLGSVATAVLRNSPVPLVCCPHQDA